MIETIASPYIHAAGDDNFKSLVLDNSKSGPVLVNFWSKKAGPSLRQYPILDKLVHHYQGRVLLVNIDADMEINISKAYGVTSVPTLKLFRDEKVVKSLHGYQSETDLMQLLDQYVARDSDQALAQAIQQYAQGNRIQAYENITQAILDDPANPRLPLTLCKLLIHEQRYTEANNFLDSLPPEISHNHEFEQLQDRLSFLIMAAEIGDVDALLKHAEAAPNDPEAKIKLTAYYILMQDYQAALAELVKLMDIDQNYKDDYARAAMLKIFRILGEDNELTQQFRASLQRYAH